MSEASGRGGVWVCSDRSVLAQSSGPPAMLSVGVPVLPRALLRWAPKQTPSLTGRVPSCWVVDFVLHYPVAEVHMDLLT